MNRNLQILIEQLVKQELDESLSTDKLGKAIALEQSLVDVANGTTPKNFAEFSKVLIGDLGLKGAGNRTGAGASLTEFWSKNGGTNTTPKTDLIIGSNKISLKMGSGQFMSGERGEVSATLAAALDLAGYSSEGYAKEVLDMVGGMQKSLLYSANVTDIRSREAYKSGKATKDADIIRLKAQEEFQARLQESLESILDPETNPKLKLKFVLEAIGGKVKFGGGAGTADYLLATAGKQTIYGSGKKTKSLSDKDLKSNISGLYAYSPIDDALARKYVDQVSIIVKFKTRSPGDDVREEDHNASTLSDVVGIMLKEAVNFVTLGRKLREESYRGKGGVITESMVTDFVDKMKSLWSSFKTTMLKLLSAAKVLLFRAASAGWQSLLGFIGVEFEELKADTTVTFL